MDRFFALLILLIPFASAAHAATPLPQKIGPAPGYRSAPAIVAHDAGFVAAWVDENGVLATTLDPQGERDFRFPHLLFGEAGEWREVALASNGADVFAAGGCGTIVTPAICTATISDLASRPTVRSGPRFTGGWPAVAWDGTAWVVAYGHSSFDPIIRVARVDEGGNVVGEPYDIGPGTDPDLATNGSTTLIAFRMLSGNGAGLRRLGASGPIGETLLLSPPLADNDFDFRPQLASDGTEFLAVWNRGGAIVPRVFAQRLTSEGTPNGAPLAVESPGWIESLVWGGRDYVATAADEAPFYEEYAGDEYLLRLTPDGTLRESSLLAGGPGRQADGELAWNGTTGVAVWANARTLVFDEIRQPSQTIEAFRFEPPDMSSARPAVLSIGGLAAVQPSVTSTPSGYLAVWTNLQSGPAWIAFSTLDSSFMQYGGQLPRRQTQTLDPRSQMPFGGDPLLSGSGDQRHPAAAAGTSSSLVVFTEAEEGATHATVRGLTVGPWDPQDRSLGPARTFAADAAHAPTAVAFDGVSYFVVWTAADGTLMGRRAAADGLPLGTAVALAENGFNPALAWSGSSYLLAWQTLADAPCNIPLCAPEFDVMTLGLGADGQVLNGALPVPAGRGANPAVVWAQSEFIVFADGVTASRFTLGGHPLGAATPLAVGGEFPRAAAYGSTVVLTAAGFLGGEYRVNRLDLTAALVPLRGPFSVALRRLPSSMNRAMQTYLREPRTALTLDGSAMVRTEFSGADPLRWAPYLVIERTARPGRGRTAAR